jgi:hypothetical protein
MARAVTKTRIVVLLGRRPSTGWEPSGDKRLRKDDELVLLSVGYPVTVAQREAFLRAQELTEAAGAWLDARLVTSIDEALQAIEPGDEVLVMARGREGKRLRARLAAHAPLTPEHGRAPSWRRRGARSRGCRCRRPCGSTW